MRVSAKRNGRDPAIVDLFRETFAASEGAAEGESIGSLVRDLLVGTAPEDIRVFTAEAEDLTPAAIPAAIPTAAAIFTRLTYPQDDRTVFLLSPFGVATALQGQGIGQELLGQALDALRIGGVDVVVTYGDPAFYGKVGFVPLDQDIARPPLPLSQPEGWLGCGLGAGGIAPLAGPSTCVTALRDPRHW